MQTIFFVPQDENPEDYYKECELWGYPIVHGVSKNLAKHDLNFAKAGVLKIPERINFAFRDEFAVGNHQKVMLQNEFVDLRDGYTLNVLNKRTNEFEYENLKPFYAEKHYMKWVFQILKTGKYALIVVKDGEPVDFIESKGICYAFLRAKLWN